jgi:hypothetical protein
VHVGFLDDGHQGLLCRPARLEKAREVAAPPELRDLQRDPPSSRIPVAVAVSVALNLPQRRACTLGRPRPGLNLRLHDPFGRKGQHLAHKIAIGLLLNQFDQRHSVIGHRRLHSWFKVLQPEPSRRSAMAASVTPGRALRYAGGSARGLLHQALGHYRINAPKATRS